MTQITATRRIPLPPEQVFNAAQQVERFPELLPNVDRVTVLENDGAGHTVTRWEGTISLGPLTRQVRWTERDEWDDAERTCRFELVEGDMRKYSGVWIFAGDGDGCRVTLDVDFELGIPMLGPMILRIVDQLMQDNCERLLEALEQLAAG